MSDDNNKGILEVLIKDYHGDSFYRSFIVFFLFWNWDFFYFLLFDKNYSVLDRIYEAKEIIFHHSLYSINYILVVFLILSVVYVLFFLSQLKRIINVEFDCTKLKRNYIINKIYAPFLFLLISILLLIASWLIKIPDLQCRYIYIIIPLLYSIMYSFYYSLFVKKEIVSFFLKHKYELDDINKLARENSELNQELKSLRARVSQLKEQNEKLKEELKEKEEEYKDIIAKELNKNEEMIFEIFIRTLYLSFKYNNIIISSININDIYKDKCSILLKFKLSKNSGDKYSALISKITYSSKEVLIFNKIGEGGNYYYSSKELIQDSSDEILTFENESNKVNEIINYFVKNFDQCIVLG